jgi:hypothetical protein
VNALTDLHSLWIGPRVSWLEQLCLLSWLAHGHRAVLWAYERVEMVPGGVEMRDAREILPETAIIRHRSTGSVALFANRFRYHLLERFPVTWVDTDMLLLGSIADDLPYLFAWETQDSICNAVLRLPASSPVLHDLLKLTNARVPVPQWWPLKQRLRQRIRGLVSRHETAENMKWGTFGPRAVTETLRHHHLLDQARPSDVFYPALWHEAALFWESPEIMEARLTNRTIAVHLWSTSSLILTPELARKRHAPLPMRSWIGQKCAAYRVSMHGT